MVKTSEKPLLAALQGGTQERAIRHRSGQIFSDITAGLTTGVISVFSAISLAVMVFSGDLDSFISLGLGITLLSNLIIRAVVALRSSFAGAISNPQPEQMVILALMAASISQHLPASASPDTLLATVIVAIALSSLLTGLLLVLLGAFQVGNLVRYVPYPIVGGFLAGIGLLLVEGAIKFLLQEPVSWMLLGKVLQPDRLLYWLPSLIYAVLLLVASRRLRHPLTVPLSFVGAIALFYGILALTQTSMAQATAQGWLLGPFPQGNLWHPMPLSSLSRIHWPAIAMEIGSMASLVLLTTLSLLLNAVGLEVLTEKDINLKQELRSVGLANLLSGAVGGVAGSHSLRSSILAYRMNGRGRLVGLAAAAVFGVVLLMGGSFLSIFPRPVLGGLLMYLGLALLVEWGYEAYFKLPRDEYVIVCLILAIVGLAGLLQGIGIGLVAAVFIFVFRYSRVDATRRVLSGITHQSNVARSPAQMQVLSEQGDQIFILELQGFLFFGTANNLLNRVRQRLENDEQPRLRFIIFDWRLVSGADASTLLSLGKIRQLVAPQGVQILLTAVRPELRQTLQQGSWMGNAQAAIHWFPDLDRGLEWCENQILAAATAPFEEESTHLLFLDLFPDPLDAQQFISYLKPVAIAPGETLFHQGEPADGIYILTHGQVSVLVNLPDGRTKRLRALGSGSIVGEMGVYTQRSRSASVVADQPSHLYFLSQQSLTRIEAEAPAIATRLHKFIISSLSDRLDSFKHETTLLVKPRRRVRSALEELDVSETFDLLGTDPLETDPFETPKTPSSAETNQTSESHCFETSKASRPEDGIGLEEPSTAEQRFLDLCRQCLTTYVGPIADLMVQDAIAKHPQASPEQLIQLLAAEIPDGERAMEFQQECDRLWQNLVEV
ncbi:MAG: SulP family inorganic anion transporter [Synechococcales bacterium]|nr:SulP family inorganic anion transporter [Synechococcales bacterium]